ncbi:hypothetical protein MYX06_02475 [Patescibacteria group bacterium AH-259-L05]|nr:hypothetical protein [Patescibacteria group bacterium AH-259-L05]
MSKKHDIVGKDWAIVDVLTQLFHRLDVDEGRGLNINYTQIIEKTGWEPTAKVRVKVVGWYHKAYILIQLKKPTISNTWRAVGHLVVRFGGFDTIGYNGRRQLVTFSVEQHSYLGERGYKFKFASDLDRQTFYRVLPHKSDIDL